MSMIGHNHVDISPEGLSAENRHYLDDVIKELNDSLTRIAAERDLQKESIKEAVDKTGIDGKLLRRMAKAYFLANFTEIVLENERFEKFYDTVIHNKIV